MEPPPKKPKYRSQAGRKKIHKRGPNDIHNWRERYRQWKEQEIKEPDPNARFPPTEAPPGSAEKIEVLRDRVANGLPLWHEDDAGFA